jgi:hypothetical protein
MEDSFEFTPDAESQGDLSPPPRKPPTAVSVAPDSAAVELPIAVRAWRRGPPTLVASAVSTLFDVLDLIGDTIAEKAGLRP